MGEEAYSKYAHLAIASNKKKGISQGSPSEKAGNTLE